MLVKDIRTPYDWETTDNEHDNTHGFIYTNNGYVYNLTQ